jgi:hypothetical protein
VPTAAAWLLAWLAISASQRSIWPRCAVQHQTAVDPRSAAGRTQLGQDPRSSSSVAGGPSMRRPSPSRRSVGRVLDMEPQRGRRRPLRHRRNVGDFDDRDLAVHHASLARSITVARRCVARSHEGERFERPQTEGGRGVRRSRQGPFWVSEKTPVARRPAVAQIIASEHKEPLAVPAPCRYRSLCLANLARRVTIEEEHDVLQFGRDAYRR